MAPKPRFVLGEKVLCFQSPLLYEAKCLKLQSKDKETMEYLIHYNGWNKNFDEWVPESRIYKYNEANLQKQKELAKTHVKTKNIKSASRVKVKKEPVETIKTPDKRVKVKKEPVETIKTPDKKETLKEPIQTSSSTASTASSSTASTASSSTASTASSSTASTASILRKTEKKVSASSSSTEQNDENQPERKKKKVRFAEPSFLEEAEEKVEIKLDFPEFLKNWLLDDWDLITRQKKILRLPARVTVDHIIAGFVQEKVSVKGISQSMENTIVKVANKLRDCFNVLLGKMLLYKFERPQYAEIYVEYRDRGMCHVYGAIHLLRMFTKLEELLTPIAETVDTSSLVGHLKDFVKYLSLNPNFFNLDDYVVAAPEYLRRAL